MKNSKNVLPAVLLMLASTTYAQKHEWKKPIDKEIINESRVALAEYAHNKGFDLYQKGKLQDAMFEYLNAIKVDSTFAEAYEDLGLFFLQSDDEPNAKKYLKQAIASYHYKAGILCFLLGDYEQAKSNLTIARTAGITIPTKVQDTLKL